MMTLPLALALALAAEPVNPGAAGPGQAPPRPGPPPELRLPESRRFTLENGLAVTLVKVGRMPKATVQLSIRAGKGDEGPDQAGLASFVAGMLVEGTTRRSAGEIAAQAARWGGSVDADVTADETVVGGTVLSEFAPDLVELVADVAQHPAFPAKELERVRQDLVREVTIARTMAQTLAQERFLAATYPGDAYGRLLPTPEQLRAYPPDAVRAFHGAAFGARRAHLYVAGQFDAAAVEKALREAFGGWAPGTPYARGSVTPASARLVHLVERPGAVQSSLYVGLPVLDPRSPDYLRLVVTNTVLGGYFSSRMTANLREAKGYTYSPASVVSVRAGAPGYWAEVADVTTAVTGASLTEIFKEVDRLRAEAPGAGEVAAAQAYLAGQYLLQTSRREGLVERLRFVDLHGLPDAWLEGYVRELRAVTPEEVQRMALTWLDGRKMTVVVVGDRKLVERQVRGVGRVVVTPVGTAPARPAPVGAAPRRTPAPEAAPAKRDARLLPRKEARR